MPVSKNKKPQSKMRSFGIRKQKRREAEHQAFLRERESRRVSPDEIYSYLEKVRLRKLGN